MTTREQGQTPETDQLEDAWEYKLPFQPPESLLEYYAESCYVMRKHARKLERQRDELVRALEPFAALMAACERVHPAGTWRFVAMSDSNGNVLQITQADVEKARAALASVKGE